MGRLRREDDVRQDSSGRDPLDVRRRREGQDRRGAVQRPRSTYDNKDSEAHQAVRRSSIGIALGSTLSPATVSKPEALLASADFHAGDGLDRDTSEPGGVSEDTHSPGVA